jgi:RNA polymerase sigma-70 factor, ECF subfamily
VSLARLLCGAEDEAVERALVEALDRARSEAPGVVHDDDAFVVELARRLPPGEGIAALRVEALWLTLAAAAGQERAVALIEQRHFGAARKALAGLGGGVADEALQRVREALFVGPRPKIAAYAGKGDLGRWIRTTAMRAAMDLLAPQRERPTDDEGFAGFALPGGDPGVELMKREYGERFQVALREAMARLPPEAREELRLYYLEGLGLEQIAALEGVAASTVSRRLEKARRELRDATRAALAERLGVGDEELDSIIRLLDTRLELSRSALERAVP